MRNKTLWLSQQYLLVTLGLKEEYLRESARKRYRQSVSPSYHSRDILPDTGKSWRWGTINDAFYYAYDNIPDKAPECYRSALPSRQELTALAGTSAAKPDFENTFKNAVNNYYKYLPAYHNCTRAQQTNLAKAASLFEAAISYIKENNIPLNKSTFFAQLGQFVEANDIKYFPGNPRVIKRKIEPFLSDSPRCEGGVAAGALPTITTAIHLPRANNANAAKGFDDQEITAWVLQLRDYGANYTNNYIINKVQNTCRIVGKPVPSERWIGKKILETHNTNFLTAQQRFGAKGRFGAMYRGYQPFQNALFAGDCWQIDGTRVNLLENKKTVRFTNKETGAEEEKIVTPYLYIVAVRDVHSGMILGHSFTIAEDHKANYIALDMAVRNAGYLPYELVHDRFPGHNYKPMEHFLNTLRQWGVKVTISSDPNSKAGLERWFGTMQTVFMQDSRFYYGQGIKSRRTYAHRSPEYMKRLRAEAAASGWDWDAACAEADTLIDNYNTTLYSQWSRKHAHLQQSPSSLHELSEKPNTYTLQHHEYAFLLGIRDRLPHQAGLIKKTLNHVDYYYRITDYSLISSHANFLCCFDYNDMSRVELYTVTDGPISQYLCTVQEEQAAQVYGPSADWGTVSSRKALIKDIADFAAQEIEYRKAVGDDIVSAIYPTTVAKHRAEAAETAFLQSNIPDHEPDDFAFNPLNQL